MIDQIREDVKQKYQAHPKRYQHILGVVQTAISLATRYGVDTKDAYIAAIFHDYTKNDTIEAQISVLSEDVIKTYQHFPVMYHALSAAKILRTRHNVHDENILNAIRYHVNGRKGMTTLEKIILVADKIEPSRNYPIVEKLRILSLNSLDDTIKLYLEDLLHNPDMTYITNKTEIKEIIKSIGE